MATQPTAPAGPAGPSRLRDLILGALLFAATVAVYLPSLNGEFFLNDDLRVTRPELRSLHGLARIWSEVGATQLSKTATATLPAALLVILWWQRSRLGWKRDVRPLLPWLAAGAFAGSITIVVERRLTAGFHAAFALTWIDRGGDDAQAAGVGSA